MICSNSKNPMGNNACVGSTTYYPYKMCKSVYGSGFLTSFLVNQACSDCKHFTFVSQIGSLSRTVCSVIWKWSDGICVSKHHKPICICCCGNNEGKSDNVHRWCCFHKKFQKPPPTVPADNSLHDSIGPRTVVLFVLSSTLPVSGRILLSCSNELLSLWIWCYHFVSHCQWCKGHFEFWFEWTELLYWDASVKFWL